MLDQKALQGRSLPLILDVEDFKVGVKNLVLVLFM